MDYDYLFKVIVVGDSGVGKSCLLMRLCDEDYSDTFSSTIGVDFKIKTLPLYLDGVTKHAKIQFYDTAGQERFRSIVSSYYRGAHCIFICFDVTDAESFTNVLYWLEECQRGASSKVLYYLIGTKTDATDRRVVSRDIAEAIARERGMMYIETSARANQNIGVVLDTLSRTLVPSKTAMIKPEVVAGREVKRTGCC